MWLDVLQLQAEGLKLILQRSSAQVIKTMLQRAYHTRDE